MQKIGITILWFIVVFEASAQIKHDYNWILGDLPSANDSAFGGTTISFLSDSVSIFYDNRILDIELTNANISSPSGRLMAYTNGCYIANSKHEIIDSSKINPGNLFENNCGAMGDDGYTIPQGALFLPNPKDSNLFHLFHQRIQLFNNPFDVEVDQLLYSVVRFSNTSEGKMVIANDTLINIELFTGLITAVKHQNEKDWWIICPENANNGYFRILFTENGVDAIINQKIGLPSHERGGSSGQAVFSPDGTQYVRYNKFDGLYIMDFDRNTGLFSNFRHVVLADTMYTGGVAISSNSRFLYVSNSIYLYQFDLEAADIPGSKILIDTYDGYREEGFFHLTFYLMQLAPDCKIYMNSTNGAKHLHVINYPNKKGKACDFRQHEVPIPTWNSATMPNYPNFRLGSEFPVCDSSLRRVVTAIRPHPVTYNQKFKVFPNPASDLINIQWRREGVSHIRCFDTSERLVQSFSVKKTGTQFQLDVSGFHAGMYYFQFLDDQGSILGGEKFVVARYD